MRYCFFGLWFSLALPSVGLFKKAGWQWALGYLFFSVIGVWVAMLLFKLAQRFSVALWLLRVGAVLCVLLAATLFFIYHPVIDDTGFQVGAIQVGASDTNNAIDIGVSSVLHGKNPYIERTFLGNPLTPLPGSFLLAFPFYLLKNSSLQNLFWIGLFVFLFARATRRPGSASALIILLILGSPCILYRIVTGGDYFSNNIYIMTALLAMWRARPESTLAWIGSAVFAGITYASRPNFLFLGPMMLLLLSRKTSWKHSFRAHAVTGVVFLLLVLPFLLYDPANFSPLHLTDKVQFGGFGAMLTWLVPVVGFIASILFGIKGRVEDEFGLFRYAFWIQTIMVFVVMFFASIHDGYLRWDQEPVLAFLFLFFGVYGYGAPLVRGWGLRQRSEFILNADIPKSNG